MVGGFRGMGWGVKQNGCRREVADGKMGTEHLD